MTMQVSTAQTRVQSDFFFNDTATTEIYTLSLHDALPIYARASKKSGSTRATSKFSGAWTTSRRATERSSSRASSVSDRKSTRLNSSHANISYAVFCLKKKKKHYQQRQPLHTASLSGMSTV